MSAIRDLAEELPEHQTSRGREFRTIPAEERDLLAKPLVMARSQAQATDADWDDQRFLSEIAKKKNMYFYNAGQLHLDVKEANHIWWSVVYDDPSPAERRDLI